MIEIAKAARTHFDILFVSYGGQFEDLIKRINGFGAFCGIAHGNGWNIKNTTLFLNGA